MAESKHTHREEFRVNGDELLARVRKLITEGNVRRMPSLYIALGR